MASLQRKNSLNEAVKERRLRPIYELLDIGFNKKVLQEADRLLKKQPNNPTILALKGLALLRMGKKEECTSLITPIFEDVPTDDNTIQALSICFREMDKPEMVCQLLENSCKKDKSEDNLTYCFMSYVRVMDFQKQHQIATTLYKTYPKPPYITWAVMSLLVKSINEPLETAERLTLPLAERMMTKFVMEQKVESEHEISLYIMVLMKLKKYESCYELLTRYQKCGISWTPGILNRLMWQCLKNTNDMEAQMNFLESMLIPGSSENAFNVWRFHMEYVNLFAIKETKRVEDYLKKCLIESATLTTKNGRRSIYLAMMLFFKMIKVKDPYYDNTYFKGVFEKHINEYGGKPFYYYDVSVFLKSFDKPQDIENVVKFFEDSVDPNSWNRYEVPMVQRQMNVALVRHYYWSEDKSRDPLLALEYVGMNIKKYIEYREKFLNSKLRIDPRDVQPFDDFLTLASLTLMRTFWDIESLESFWCGYFLCNDMRRFGIKPEPKVGNNGGRGSRKSSLGDIYGDNGLGPVPMLVSEPKFNLPEQDFPILLCMAILEFGLDKSPYCSQLRILLGKSYSFCGAVVAGTDQFMRLDLKHAQIESLGYLFLWKTIRSGVLMDAVRIINHSEAFYSSHLKESMEHILSSYKYGSWDKILEFMQFRHAIFTSVQAMLLKIEKQLLEYTKDANTHEIALQIATRDNFEVKKFILNNVDGLNNNWDLKVLQTYSQTKIEQETVNLLVNDERERLKVRASMLSLINNFIHLSNETKEEERFNERIQYIESVLKLFSEYIYQDFDQFKLNQTCIEGPGSPTMWEYQSSGCLNLLQKYFGLLLLAAKEPHGTEVFNQMKFVEEMTKDRVELELNRWRRVKYYLANFSGLIESVYRMIETLGFCSILVGVLKCLFQKDSGSTGKGKKKKAKDGGSSDVAWTLGYHALVVQLSGSMKEVEIQMSEFKFASGEWYPVTWMDLQGMWKGKACDEILNNVLPFCMPTVTDKLNTSYYRAFHEMKLNVHSKRKYVENLSTEVYYS